MDPTNPLAPVIPPLAVVIASMISPFVIQMFKRFKWTLPPGDSLWVWTARGVAIAGGIYSAWRAGALNHYDFTQGAIYIQGLSGFVTTYLIQKSLYLGKIKSDPTEVVAALAEAPPKEIRAAISNVPEIADLVEVKGQATSH